MNLFVLCLIVPLFLWLGLPLLAATMLERWRDCQFAERRANSCFHCNYDLRGNPDALRCPECGRVVGDRMPTQDRL